LFSEAVDEGRVLVPAISLASRARAIPSRPWELSDEEGSSRLDFYLPIGRFRGVADNLDRLTMTKSSPHFPVATADCQ
jgi:hypothetical protein